MQQIYLAPLEGITTYIFRNAIAKYYGGIDRFYTPFLTASHLKGRELRDVKPENNMGLDIVPQILTNDAELFLVITKQLAELGYREVNLNLGCPSGTVVSKGRGAGFLENPEKVDRFLDEIFSSEMFCYGDNSKEKSAENSKEDSEEDSEEKTDKRIKLSVKTRIGMEFLSEWEDILQVYIKYPIEELIIHPRLREDFYNGEVRLDTFKRAMELYDGVSTKLCYNGDIVDIMSYQNIKNELSLSDDINIMIGRGLLANPNLANELRAYESGQGASLHNTNSTGIEANIKNFDKKKFKEFISEITENYIDEMSNEKQVVMKMKELWTYFGKGLGLDNKQMKEIYKTSRLADYRNAVQMVLS